MFNLKMLLGSVLALVLGLAVASPIIFSNLEIGPKANIGVDVVYAHFEVQEFSQNTTGLWRNLSDPLSRDVRFISYFIVLNVTNHSDELAMIDVFEVAAAPKIVVEGVSVSMENAIATDARDLRRGYPAFFSQFWSPKESRLIGLTGMKTVPIVAFDALINGSLNLFGRAEGRLYGGGPQSSGFGLKHVQLQMFGKEFLYNVVALENQLLIIDTNGIDVRIEPGRWLVSRNEDLEGTTFKVYLYVVKEGMPVGPRDVTRGANLSSPSVAYRHLQKLEALGLLQKNAYGEYLVREKAKVKGHVWIGRNLVPRLIFYSFFFMGILSVEIAIITFRFFVVEEPAQTDFIFLTCITAVAMVLFLLEGIILFLRARTD